MRISLDIVGGLSAELVCKVEIDDTSSVDAVKREIQRLEGTPMQLQRLLFRNRQLRDSDVVRRVLPRGGSSRAITLVRVCPASKELLQDLASGVLELDDIEEELRAQREVVLAAVQVDGHALQFAVETLKHDLEVVLAAVSENGLSLRHAALSMRSDRKVALAAAKRHGLSIQYMSDDLRSDVEIATAAIEKDPRALQFVADTLRGSRSFMLSTLKSNGRALAYASDDLREDKDIVLTAVRECPYAFAYASPSLQRDREFVLNSVVRINGNALQFAARDLQEDPAIIAVVMQVNPEVFAVPRYGQ